MMTGRPGRIAVAYAFQPLEGANPKKPIIETVGENIRLANRDCGLTATKNPGARAGATEVTSFKKAVKLHPLHTTKDAGAASVELAYA